MYTHHFGYVCAKKGRSGGLAKTVCKDIDNLGFGSKTVAFKSDQENAIGDLIQEVIELRSSESTLIETAPSYESKSNGIAERGVKSHEGHCRVLKIALENRLQRRISILHPVIPWLVRHVAHMLL